MKINVHVRKYFQFILAKYFFDASGQRFTYHPTRFEYWGDLLLKPFTFPIDTFLKYFNWQVILIVIVFSSLIGTTLFYYPDYFLKLIEKAIPFFSAAQMKFVCFVIVQVYLNGLFIRSLGRLSNQTLKSAWDSEVITPFLPGRS